MDISLFCTSGGGPESEFDVFIDDVSVIIRKESCGSPDPVCPSGSNLFESPGFDPLGDGSQGWSSSSGSGSIEQNSVEARSGDYLA